MYKFYNLFCSSLQSLIIKLKPVLNVIYLFFIIMFQHVFNINIKHSKLKFVVNQLNSIASERYQWTRTKDWLNLMEKFFIHSFIHCFWIFHKQFSLIKYSCQENLLISRCFRFFFAKYIISQNTRNSLENNVSNKKKYIYTLMVLKRWVNVRCTSR